MRNHDGVDQKWLRAISAALLINSCSSGNPEVASSGVGGSGAGGSATSGSATGSNATGGTSGGGANSNTAGTGAAAGISGGAGGSGGGSSGATAAANVVRNDERVAGKRPDESRQQLQGRSADRGPYVPHLVRHFGRQRCHRLPMRESALNCPVVQLHESSVRSPQAHLVTQVDPKGLVRFPPWKCPLGLEAHSREAKFVRNARRAKRATRKLANGLTRDAGSGHSLGRTHAPRDASQRLGLRVPSVCGFGLARLLEWRQSGHVPRVGVRRCG